MMIQCVRFCVVYDWITDWLTGWLTDVIKSSKLSYSLSKCIIRKHFIMHKVDVFHILLTLWLLIVLGNWQILVTFHKICQIISMVTHIFVENIHIVSSFSVFRVNIYLANICFEFTANPLFVMIVWKHRYLWYFNEKT